MQHESLLERVARLEGRQCVSCGGALCGHVAVVSIFMGLQDSPRCIVCLGRALGRSPSVVRDATYAHIRRRDCYRAGWQWASDREGFAPDALPACLWNGEAVTASWSAQTTAAGRRDPAVIAADETWHAGDMGCGELVLQLRLRLKGMLPGQVLLLTATDPGAAEDLPAWCRLTGHTLVEAAHPTYLIRRKED